jgi:hypothetical protein
MTRQKVTCDQCGAEATVRSVSQIYSDVHDLAVSMNQDGVTEYSCKIDCPVCGTRTQVVRQPGKKA